MRFHFDIRKSKRLRTNPKRGIGFEEVQEVFAHPYYLDRGWTSATSSGRSAGLVSGSIRSFSRSAKTRTANTFIW